MLTPPSSHRSLEVGRSLLIYAGLAALAFGGLKVITALGRHLTAPPYHAPAPVVPATISGSVFWHSVLALVAILVATRLMSIVFRQVGQPPVVGEIIAGLLLGPSALGLVAPGVWHFLLPAPIMPVLRTTSSIGVVLFLFLVGLETDFASVGRGARSTLAIAQTSVVAPFLLGATLALALYPRLGTSNVSFGKFALFLGISMSVTAFPVLARILTDRGMQSSPLGVTALFCAAANDVAAWCILAYVVSSTNGNGSAGVTVIATAAFVGAMILLVQPAIRRWVAARSDPALTPGVFIAILSAVAVSSMITEGIGIHAFFGAFALGAVFPAHSRLARGLQSRMTGFVTAALLPVFFAFTGTRTHVNLVTGMEGWLACGAILVVATSGKFGGTAAAARATGMSWHDAASLGVLMNARGLVELIVLNVGLDLGIISPALFAMLVLMALVTTMATSPLLSLLEARRARGRVPLADSSLLAHNRP